jgi:hypothetical protein
LDSEACDVEGRYLLLYWVMFVVVAGKVAGISCVVAARFGNTTFEV